MLGPHKKDLTPLSKGGQVHVHRGKGARPFPPQPKPGPLTAAAPGLNNYAKTTPLPTPPPAAPAAPMGPAPGMASPDSMTGGEQGMV